MNEEFNNQNHDEENVSRTDNELEHTVILKRTTKTIHYKEYLES